MPAQDTIAERGLYQVLYQSQATSSLPTLAQLRASLTRSRAYNAAHQITGLLLCSEGQFLQLLEGPEAAVLALYATIRRDRRHEQVQLVRQGAIAHRSFAAWRMGFGYMAAAELSRLVETVRMRTAGEDFCSPNPYVQALWQAVGQVEGGT